MLDRPPASRPNRAWYLLLAIPFIATLWVPFYASANPAILGVPFFYWYQFLWVIISGVLTAIVYFATPERPAEPARPVGATPIRRASHD